MFIAMNRFQIAIGSEEEFEKMWRERESYLDNVTGFQKFHLLKGPSNETYTLYASHSIWESENYFKDWTNSESFRKAHRQAHPPKGMHLGPPQFEGFKVVL